MNKEKACWNCLHEYQCNWEPAGEKTCCPDWQPETGEERSCRTCGGQCLSPGAYCVHGGYRYWIPKKLIEDLTKKGDL